MSGVRDRWGIEAVEGLPPASKPGQLYVPAGVADDADSLSEWTGDLLALYDHPGAVPESCRENVGTADFLNWAKLLSGLVLFDPPLPGLLAFTYALKLTYPNRAPRPMPAPGEPEYGMIGSPVAYPRGEDPRGPVLVIEPWHTDKDILAAAKIVRSTHAHVHAKSGRKKGVALLDGEVALLHDELGWTHERLWLHYGWRSYTRASKHLRNGRRILDSLP